jgi:O-antigen/teichoic acid export membrane protein
MTGTTIAQAIPVAISPILTRIYKPEDFGVYALFVAVASIFGVISAARYESAIMLPESDEDALNIAALGLMICVALTIILFITIFAFNRTIAQMLGNAEIGFWLYFIPLSVFFMGLYNVLNYFNIRIKNYKDIAKVTIFKTIIVAVVQLSVGFLKVGAAGLVSGQILSNMFGNLRLLKNTIAKVECKKALSLKKIKILAVRYRNFPKYSLFATLANALSQHLISILISAYFSVVTLGFYSLVQRLLGMPSALIGGSIGQVFFQAATKEKQQTGKVIKTFDSTIKKLLIISLPSFGILFFIVEDLFVIVFGEEWRIAGVYAKILIPLFGVRFIVGTVSILNTVFEKNKTGLFIQLVLLLSTVTIFGIANYFELEFVSFLYILMIVMVVEYIVFYFYLFHLAQGKIN